jgi:hypothetical protein
MDIFSPFFPSGLFTCPRRRIARILKEIPLTPMSVLATGSAHFRPSSQLILFVCLYVINYAPDKFSSVAICPWISQMTIFSNHHISSSSVKIRLHTKNQLSMLPEVPQKCVWWCGPTNYLVTPGLCRGCVGIWHKYSSCSWCPIECYRVKSEEV